MHKFELEAKKIRELLNLKWPPIAGQFTNNADENGDSSKKLGICDAFDLVRRKNILLSISKVNCTCAGGRHFTGLEILPTESIAPSLAKQRHKVYDSISTAVASVNKQPQPVNRGDFFILGPLAQFESNPDIVFFFTNAAQADRLLGLTSFKGTEPLTYYPASSICSTITNVLASGRPQINLIAQFERRGGNWSQNEFITALPLKTFQAAIKNIPRSGYGTFKP